MQSTTQLRGLHVLYYLHVVLCFCLLVYGNAVLPIGKVHACITCPTHGVMWYLSI